MSFLSSSSRTLPHVGRHCCTSHLPGLLRLHFFYHRPKRTKSWVAPRLSGAMVPPKFHLRTLLHARPSFRGLASMLRPNSTGLSLDTSPQSRSSVIESNWAGVTMYVSTTFGRAVPNEIFEGKKRPKSGTILTTVGLLSNLITNMAGAERHSENQTSTLLSIIVRCVLSSATTTKHATSSTTFRPGVCALTGPDVTDTIRYDRRD